MIQIDDLIVDIAISEEHSFENEVTDHPVESGGNVTDNTIDKPLTITITGLVSNTPLTQTGTAIPGATQASPFPADRARDKLLALKKARNPITVVDSLGTWPNMVLEKLSIPRDAKIGDALKFTATFKELVIATNERTVVAVSMPRAAALQKLGHRTTKQPPEPPPSAKTEDHRTALHKLLSGGADYFGYILPGDPGNPIGTNVPEP
jgi:hypothetical protein